MATAMVKYKLREEPTEPHDRIRIALEEHWTENNGPMILLYALVYAVVTGTLVFLACSFFNAANELQHMPDRMAEELNAVQARYDARYRGWWSWFTDWWNEPERVRDRRWHVVRRKYELRPDRVWFLRRWGHASWILAVLWPGVGVLGWNALKLNIRDVKRRKGRISWPLVLLSAPIWVGAYCAFFAILAPPDERYDTFELGDFVVGLCIVVSVILALIIMCWQPLTLLPVGVFFVEFDKIAESNNSVPLGAPSPKRIATIAQHKRLPKPKAETSGQLGEETKIHDCDMTRALATQHTLTAREILYLEKKTKRTLRSEDDLRWVAVWLLRRAIHSRIDSGWRTWALSILARLTMTHRPSFANDKIDKLAKDFQRANGDDTKLILAWKKFLFAWDKTSKLGPLTNSTRTRQ